MIQLQDGMGICQRKGMLGSPATPALWESARYREPKDKVRERQARAKIECRRCPLFDACEELLSDLEREGTPIDGIVAARESDCQILDNGMRSTSRCFLCGFRLQKQSARGQVLKSGWRQHVGEGLCSECWPHANRQARTNYLKAS